MKLICVCVCVCFSEEGKIPLWQNITIPPPFLFEVMMLHFLSLSLPLDREQQRMEKMFQLQADDWHKIQINSRRILEIPPRASESYFKIKKEG
jgi:hypothetical protein